MREKIIINGRFLSQPMTGINRFSYELTKRLVKLIDCDIVVPKKSLREDIYDITGFKIKEYGKLSSHLWEQISLYKYVLKNKGSLLLNFSGLGPIFYKKKITTIHDLSFLHNSEWFSKKYYYFYKFFTPRIASSSLDILTVSNFSKEEIIKYYNVPPEKISIIYNSVNEIFKNSHTYNIKHKDYILTVGSLDPRKNFRFLLEAFKSEKLKDVCLHVVGGSNRVFGELGLDLKSCDNIKFLGRVSDDELIKEYEGAKLFVLPSLYEGFGIPPMEALVVGCPVLLSDIPVFREIYGNSVYYFNPEDKDDLIAKIYDLSTQNITVDYDLTEQLMNKYSWEESAKKIIEVINSVS